MFGIDSSEFLVIVIIAVIVIGPKDLPRVLYKIGQVVGKAQGMARHFRTGIDAMVREVELEELEKKWAAQNQRILDEHPQTAVIEGEAVAEPLALSSTPAEALPPAEPLQSAFPGFPMHPQAAPEAKPTPTSAPESVPAKDVPKDGTAA